MIISLVEKEPYSIMPPASIHQHDCRILETKDKRIRIKLDRTIDSRPPFFTVYDLSVRKPHPQDGWQSELGLWPEVEKSSHHADK